MEFALVVPIVLMFFFGGFEFCRVAMIRHTADNAVYEGARRGIIPGGTRGEVVAEATRVLSTIGIRNAAVDVTPGRIDDDTEELTVSVTVPIDSNSFVPAQYFIGRVITRQLTMRREGQ
ncbi:MAG: TadE family protein [Planctomycetota bacterium]